MIKIIYGLAVFAIASQAKLLILSQCLGERGVVM